MTELETIEAMALLGIGAVDVFTVYISVVFAYLTVAYFLGRDLTYTQMYVISGLFLVTTTTMGATCVACVLAWEKLVPLYPSILNTIPYFTVGIWHKCMGVIFAAGVLISFYFMYNIRHTEKVKGNAVAA